MKTVLYIRFSHFSLRIPLEDFINITFLPEQPINETIIKVKKTNEKMFTSWKADATYIQLNNEKDIEFHIDGMPKEMDMRPMV